MTAPIHPVRVNAELDPNLSRWKWLVKWLLVIPHYFVLAVGCWLLGGGGYVVHAAATDLDTRVSAGASW